MAATDDYLGEATGLSSPYRHAAAVTPSDTADLADVSRALFVGGAGAVAVITEGGEAVTLTGVAAGTVLCLCVSRVKATGTTAANITALW